jgi:hypothetical protein
MREAQANVVKKPKVFERRKQAVQEQFKKRSVSLLRFIAFSPTANRTSPMHAPKVHAWVRVAHRCMRKKCKKRKSCSKKRTGSFKKT